MRASKAGPLILIAGLVVACHRSPTEVDELPDASAGPILLGTIGRGVTPGEPTGIPSTLIEIDPVTGATLRIIGPVGFVVNGMEFDPSTGTLYASTSVTDPTFNGLITIDLVTGAGTPVGATPGFGLGPRVAVNNITIDASGQLYGWWEPAEDDLVRIDKLTGIATRVGESDPGQTGFGTMNGGLDFDNSGILYVNSAFPADFHTVDLVSGAVTFAGTVTPVNDFLVVHHGDFHPGTNVLYALSDQFEPRDLLLVDVTTFTGSSPVPLEADVHVITWVPGAPAPGEECPESANSSKSDKSEKSASSSKSDKSDKSASSSKSDKSDKNGRCPS